MRELGFDAQHSTRIAFKYAAGRVAPTVTHTRTLWATRTLTRTAPPLPTHPASKTSKSKQPSAAGQEHTYLPSGLLQVNPRAAHPIPTLIAHAERAWAQKLARSSTTLRAAVTEYKRRYARAPPRGFDVWWAYAAVKGVGLPDEYDQIERDLGVFWGVEPGVLGEVTRAWEAHADSYTIGKQVQGAEDEQGKLAMLNFTLPEDERVRFELASGGFQIIDMLREVEDELPPFRAVFSPHDNPNLVMDHELRQLALDAAKKGTYIDPSHPPPQKHGWRAACAPLSPAWLDDAPFMGLRIPSSLPHSPPSLLSLPLPLPHTSTHTNRPLPTSPKTFIHDPLRAMDPCQHPAGLRTHGAYLAHGAGPSPERGLLVPQFSYSVTPLHADVRVALPINWVPDDIPSEGRPPPLGLSWAERTDARLQWRGSNTGIWHAADGRWRDAHRIRLAALGAGFGGVNVSVLDPGAGGPVDGVFGAGAGAKGFRAQGPDADPLEFDYDFDEDDYGGDGEGVGAGRAPPVGDPLTVPRARLVPALLDVAFAGRALNCEEAQCAVLEGMFEWRRGHDLRTAARYKYVLDVDGNGWSSRFKRLMNSGSLIFKATTYPEWFTDRLAPWVHYVPIQTSYTDLLDALVFFRAHDKAAERIAAAGRAWSGGYWRREDMVAYMYRLFLEYARVMSPDREAMGFEMWEDEREDGERERGLRARWEVKMRTEGEGDGPDAR
ncbi:glycosyl transferase family 90-domain-containing protein [Mycena haematopus]|nr:glycosyl transferase family 90-domain-containing protein [Mycena haematopus]